MTMAASRGAQEGRKSMPGEVEKSPLACAWESEGEGARMVRVRRRDNKPTPAPRGASVVAAAAAAAAAAERNEGEDGVGAIGKEYRESRKGWNLDWR